MRMIGTGWRYWATSTRALDDMFMFMDSLLDLIMLTNLPVLQLVLGGGTSDDRYAQGADRALMEWALAARDGEYVTEVNVPTPIVFQADWDKYGAAAGPLRNAAMVTAGADLVVGFIHPESKGTVDCLTKAKRAKIPRMIITWVPDKDPVEQPSLEVVDEFSVLRGLGGESYPVAEAA